MTELEKLENRNNDWLAQETMYENKRNIRKFDEAKELKEEHEKVHKYNDQECSKKEVFNKDRRPKQKNLQKKFILFFGIVYIFYTLVNIIMLFYGII